MEPIDGDRISSLLTQFLDVQSRRAQVVAGNLANADTPGYVASDLEFADYLKQAARASLQPDARPAGGFTGFQDEPRVVARTDATAGIDGNNVEVGREMSTLSEAGMQYLTGTNLLQSRLRLIRSAIRGS